jgi:hypothetical protein
MKRHLAALFVLLTGVAQADVGIYQGHQVAKSTGPTARVTQPEKFVQVVDWTTSQVVMIRFGVKQFSKTFTVSEATPVVVTLVGDGSVRNRANTVLAQASTEVDADTGETTVSSMLQSGFNVAAAATGAPQPARPRMMKLSGFRADAEAPTPGRQSPGSLVEIRGAVHLLTTQTNESNAAGEVLAAAVQRVVAGLIASGFEDKTVYEEEVVEEPVAP